MNKDACSEFLWKTYELARAINTHSIMLFKSHLVPRDDTFHRWVVTVKLITDSGMELVQQQTCEMHCTMKCGWNATISMAGYFSL